MTLNLEANLEKRFTAMSSSAGSIQSLSSLCLHYKNHHKKVAQIWLRCLQKSKSVNHRLTLIYLANDIVQNAKRKNTLSFIEDFKCILKDSVPYLRDERIKKSVERVFSIWQDRNIFDNKFTFELKSLLNNTVRTPQTIEKPCPPRETSDDLMASLNRIAEIERNIDKIKSEDDNIVEKLAHGSISDSDINNTKSMEDLKTYIVTLRSEIEERNKLSRLLEDSVITQKKLLKESEEQLLSFKSQLGHITKLRNDLG